VGSQLSRPYQIALVGAVALVLVWFFALRPKGDSGSSSSQPAPTPAPAAAPKPAASKPATPFGRAVSKARGASAASDASNQRLQQGSAQASGEAPARSAPRPAPAHAAAASPAAKTPPAQRPTPNAQATNAPRVLVVLFWNKGASDDRIVRTNLNLIDRHRGRVAIAAAPIQDVGRYGPITSGVKVLESPTVIVLDTHSRSARTITGYTDVRELDQAVAESLRAG
jgi:hypothetical protein